MIAEQAPPTAVDSSLPAPTVPKAQAVALGTASIKSTQTVDFATRLSALRDEVGIFSQYVARMETTLNVQTLFRTDGVTSQAFTDDSGITLFTLERKPGLLSDSELRDKTRMYLFGIHKRRYRRPRQ